MASPLLPVEQYIYTDGACQVFVAAASRLVKEGVPTLLFATDPRQLAAHDWPQDTPLDIHIFLTLPDGNVLDAEGVRPLADLLAGFGIRKGWSYELKYDVPLSALGVPASSWVSALEERLTSLGWSSTDLPVSTRVLSNSYSFRAAREAAPLWVKENFPPPQVLLKTTGSNGPA